MTVKSSKPSVKARVELVRAPTPKSGLISKDPSNRTYAELDHWYRAHGTSLYQRSVELLGGSYKDRCKQQLLLRANAQLPKPSHSSKDSYERRLSTALTRLTEPLAPGYDQSFDTEIRRVAPQWFQHTAALNKHVLLARARDGLPKPSKAASVREERRLASVLSSYLLSSSSSYDSAFTVAIQEAAPHWFVDTATLNKQRLKAWAQSNSKRPSCQARDNDERRLGNALVHYTTTSGDSYDAVFDTEIRTIAPMWFEDSAAVKKQILRSMAANGQPRPSCTRHATEEGKLASALSRYTNSNSGRPSYDPVFDAEIRKMAPQWFTDSADIKKQMLLVIAKNGQARPSSTARTPEECQLGQALSGYTNKNAKTYDPVFDTQIHKLAPKWFEDTATIKKQQLLKMAAAKQAKPTETESDESRRLIQSLRNYTRPASVTYDAIFDAKIRQLAPQWFENSAAVKKQRLLQHATDGLDRPASGSVLGKALNSYMTQRVNGYDCYDPIFTAEIQKAAPAWFQPRLDTVAIKKQQLLARARANLPKPVIDRRSSLEEHQLGLALQRFTNPTRQTYDPTFTVTIQKAAPSWFLDAVADKKQRLLARARDGHARPTERRGNDERQLGKALRRYTNPTSPGYDPDFDEEIQKTAPKWFKHAECVKKTQ